MNLTSMPAGRRGASKKRHVIVGGGIAGLFAAEAIRAAGDDGKILLLGAEAGLPYGRPPLSKELLLGRLGPDDVALRTRDSLATQKIEYRPDVTVMGLDTSEREIVLKGGARIPFDQLLIATGARPKKLVVPGHQLSGVQTLRTLEDALRAKLALRSARSVVVVGAGLLGLEVASAASDLGKNVVVLESQTHVLGRIVPSPLGARIRQLHERHGVEISSSTSVASFVGEERLEGVVLDDGRVIEADFSVVSIGVRPNTDWLEGSPVEVDDGVLVDTMLKTNVPGIWAAGDVARVVFPHAGAKVRFESYGSALTQGTLAGSGMAGFPRTFEPGGGMTSSNFGRRIQMEGKMSGSLRYWGAPSRDDFTVVALDGDILTGVFTVGRPRDVLEVRRMLGTRSPVDQLEPFNQELGFV